MAKTEQQRAAEKAAELTQGAKEKADAKAADLTRRAMDLLFNLAWLQVALRDRHIKGLEIKLNDAETWLVRVSGGEPVSGPNLGDVLQRVVEIVAEEQGL